MTTTGSPNPMRSLALLLIIAAFACGNTDNVPPPSDAPSVDASPAIDAPVVDASNVDADPMACLNEADFAHCVSCTEPSRGRCVMTSTEGEGETKCINGPCCNWSCCREAEQNPWPAC